MYNTIQRLLLIAVLFLILQVQTASSQVSSNIYTADSRLYEFMDKAYVDKLSADRSDLIPYYNFYLENSYYVTSLKAEKPVTGTDIHTVLSTTPDNTPGQPFSEKAFVKGKFNVLKYNFTRVQDGFTTYIWKEAGIALVFYPQRQLQAQFNDYLKKHKL